MDNKIDKKTREYEVSGNQKLTLPLLSINQMQIVVDEESELYVKELIHDEQSLGFPIISMYQKYGLILQAIDATSAHVLLVINDNSALGTLAILTKIYDRMGYKLIIDKMTVLRPPCVEDTDETNGEAVEQRPPQDTREDEIINKDMPQDIKSTQLKIDVVGMEVA
jgi:hypothetical protein